jgi:hypothetical protein
VSSGTKGVATKCSRRDQLLEFIGAVIQVVLFGAMLAGAIMVLLNYGTAALQVRYQGY